MVTPFIDHYSQIVLGLQTIMKSKYCRNWAVISVGKLMLERSNVIPGTDYEWYHCTLNSQVQDMIHKKEVVTAIAESAGAKAEIAITKQTCNHNDPN
jgi:metal-dependent amidase/aminoacylase/carboxypeptidase family protein